MKPEKVDIVIDGTNGTLGRLASYSAKQALLGKKIAIVNCDKIVIVGRPREIIDKYRARKKLGGSALKGPFYSNVPEKIVKRTIRGMLSYKQERGNNAWKRIMCYNKVPEEYKDSKKVLAGKEKRGRTIKLKELSEKI